MITRRVALTIPVSVERGEDDENVFRAAVVQMARQYIEAGEDMAQARVDHGWTISVSPEPSAPPVRPTIVDPAPEPAYEQLALWGEPVVYISPPPDVMVIPESMRLPEEPVMGQVAFLDSRRGGDVFVFDGANWVPPTSNRLTAQAVSRMTLDTRTFIKKVHDAVTAGKKVIAMAAPPPPRPTYPQRAGQRAVTSTVLDDWAARKGHSASDWTAIPPTEGAQP